MHLFRMIVGWTLLCAVPDPVLSVVNVWVWAPALSAVALLA
jgi:hypothetical protein